MPETRVEIYIMINKEVCITSGYPHIEPGPEEFLLLGGGFNCQEMCLREAPFYRIGS